MAQQQTNGPVVAQLQSFLCSGTRMMWVVSFILPEKVASSNSTRRWRGPRCGLNTMAKKLSCCPCQESNPLPCSSTPQLSIYWPSYMAYQTVIITTVNLCTQTIPQSQFKLLQTLRFFHQYFLFSLPACCSNCDAPCCNASETYSFPVLSSTTITLLQCNACHISTRSFFIPDIVQWMLYVHILTMVTATWWQMWSCFHIYSWLNDAARNPD